MTRICYFSPDFPQPSGGVKTLYRHVHRLRESGFDATIVHQKQGFRASWHPYDVPVIWLQDRPQFSSTDVLVFPEVMADAVRQSQQLGDRRVVIALSWAPAYNRLQPGERWQDLGINHVLAKSRTVQRILKWQMGIDVTIIPEFVDPRLYHVESESKDPQVAYMTRKDRSGEWLQGVLTGKGAPFSEFAWQPLRNLDEASYAAHLRRSAIFLPTTLQEAMHVSILEAMACGCLVIGYTGIGGKEYMIGAGEGQNAILVENGDLHALGHALEETMVALHRNPDQFAAIIENGIATARAFQNAEAEIAALRTFFGSFD